MNKKLLGKPIDEITEFKPHVKKSDPLHYVSDADMIYFITKNSGMDWNTCCEYVRENNITGEEGSAHWSKSDVETPSNEGEKWVNAFFKAHPWITNMMVVFDD